MVAFDTLQVAKELEAAFTPEQAEALVKVFARALTEDLPTKRDLADMETRLRGEINDLETRLRGEISDVRGKINDVEIGLRGKINDVESRLRGEIKDLKVDIVRWIVGALLVNFFGISGLIITLIKSIAH